MTDNVDDVKDEADSSAAEDSVLNELKDSQTPDTPKVPVKETPKDENEEQTEESDDSESTDEEKAEDTQSPTDGEKRKDDLNTEIRGLVAQKNALKAEVEKKNAEVYAPATEEELVADGMSEADAKVEALRQEIEMDKYNTQVADAQLTIYSESKQVLDDFPIFNPKSDSYEKELAEEVGALLDDNLIYDENSKELIGSNISPYKLYKSVAKAYESSAQKNQIKGQRNTEKMIASSDQASGSPPPKTKSDPVLSILKSDD